MPVITLSGKDLQTWELFHSAFEHVMGFPSFYGRNMNAWIDCMSYLDDPTAGMTSIQASAADPLVIQIVNVDAMPDEIFRTFVDCAAFVNFRRMEQGASPLRVVSYFRDTSFPA